MNIEPRLPQQLDKQICRTFFVVVVVRCIFVSLKSETESVCVCVSTFDEYSFNLWLKNGVCAPVHICACS